MANRQARKNMTIAVVTLVLLVVCPIYCLTGCVKNKPSTEKSIRIMESYELLQEFADSVYGNNSSIENADKALEAFGSLCTPELISEIKSSIYPKIKAEAARYVHINVSFARVENTIDGAERFLITAERVYTFGTEYTVVTFKYNQSGMLQWMKILNKVTPVEGVSNHRVLMRYLY